MKTESGTRTHSRATTLLFYLVAALSCESRSSGAFPPIPNWAPPVEQREHLRRSLTLMQTSMPERRNTVRVLFYGQSITEQAWWQEVARYLRQTYSNANLVIENRAIGGHSSQLLVKTAEADLYPFQPDLLIFHVYGSHVDYEKIIQRVKETTCADILLQTDHITRDEALTEETNPSKLTPKQWDAWMNHVFLPNTSSSYAACRADVHELWKRYLQTNHLKAADLLKDGVHLNAHGEWLMAELLKRYLAPLPAKPGYDAQNNERVRTIEISSNTGNDRRIDFAGYRVDLIFRPGVKTDPILIEIDGRRPSSIPALYGFTRVSPFPNSNWPLLLKVGSQTALVSEDWALNLADASADGKYCRFSLRGSVTGEDGEGCSTNRFVSKSGRILISTEDWNVEYCEKVFKRPLPAEYEVTWKSVLHGEDKAETPEASKGVEPVVIVAQGLSKGKHSIALRGQDLGRVLAGIRAYE